jgi:hypothetical protein
MKHLVTILIAACFALISSAAKAQKTTPGKHIVKLNLTSIALKHYSLQYELVINKRQSFAIAAGISPNTGLPFKKTLLDQFGGNADAKRAIESTKFNKISITPEYRFYLGKKQAPAGFYLAPFARYTHMSIEQDYEFTPSNNKKHVAHLKGKFSGIGAGLKIGTQWTLGKNTTLDWFIAGPFIGAMSSSFTGTDDMSDMTGSDKVKLEKDIESVEIPLWTTEATVGNNKIDVKLKGPFYGVVAGLNLGIRL